ncbi:MAG: site-2 protease family protein [Waddliaceae bacterium]
MMLVYSGKIPVKIHPFFWLLAFLIGWIATFSIVQTLVWAVVIFFSVLIHEFGHALTAVSFGQQAEIELFGLGGITRRGGRALKKWQEFLIVMNGPLAGLALYFVAFQLRRLMGDQTQNLFVLAIDITIFVNLFWTLVNLLPIQPLDGGQLLNIVLEGILGFRGVKIALFISVVFSAIFSIVFFALGAFLIGALFFLFTFESYRQWKSALSITLQDQDKWLQQRYKEAEKLRHSGQLEVAYQKFQDICRQTRQGILFLSAQEKSAELLSEWGRYQEAYDLLYPYQKKLSLHSFQLLHRLAYQTGQWEEAIALGNRSFRNDPNAETALINALSHSILGQTQPAIGWLQTAINKGLPNLSQVLERREFDHIRDHPQFQHLPDQTDRGS